MSAPYSLKIDLIMAGQPLPSVYRKYGDYDGWFKARMGGEADFQSHFVTDGEPVPDPIDSDGWIISGSSSSVTDDLQWIRSLEDGIRQADSAGTPILGVCFGHQLIAQALGGTVGRNPHGWELGQSRVQLSPAGQIAEIFSGFEQAFPVYETHQDAVMELPPGSTVLAENHQAIQAFSVGRSTFGVQFHPEFSREVAQIYVLERQGEVNEPGQPLTSKAEDSARVLANFFNILNNRYS